MIIYVNMSVVNFIKHPKDIIIYIYFLNNIFNPDNLVFQQYALEQ
jgi:hypothetical protein